MPAKIDDAINILLVSTEESDHLLIQSLLAQTPGAECEVVWVRNFEAAKTSMASAD